MARRATFIKAQRKENEHVLLLDAGEALQAPRGPVRESKGAAMIEAMNMMGYDAMTLGAQDLLWGVSVLRERIAQARFPVLSANVVIKESGQLFAKPYTIVPMAGHKIGIIGLTELAGEMPPAAGEKESFLILDPLSTVKRYAEEVAAQADVVILLSHVGVNLDQAISEQVPEIDIIIGGQTRRLLYPTRFNNRGAVVAQAGYQGEWIGLLKAEIDPKGNVLSFTGTSVALDPSYADDPEMAQFVQKIKGT